MNTLTRDEILALPTSAAFTALTNVVQRLTGREVGAQHELYYIDEYAAFQGHISIPHNDAEGLLHELCHWVVAGPLRRNLDNYGLESGTSSRHSQIREEICCGWIEAALYEQAGVEMPRSSVHENRYFDFPAWQPVALSRWQRHVDQADQIIVVEALRLPGGDVSLWSQDVFDQNNLPVKRVS